MTYKINALEYGGKLWLYSVSFRWLTLGYKRALQVPKSPIRLCLLDRRGGRHLPCSCIVELAGRPSLGNDLKMIAIHNEFRASEESRYHYSFVAIEASVGN